MHYQDRVKSPIKMNESEVEMKSNGDFNCAQTCFPSLFWTFCSVPVTHALVSTDIKFKSNCSKPPSRISSKNVPFPSEFRVKIGLLHYDQKCTSLFLSMLNRKYYSCDGN